MLHSRMLRFLDEVERAGSIRRASTRLNVAASSINRQIIALEQDIGLPLFERLNNRLRLTESGALLIAHIRQTLQQHERVMARIEDLKRKRRSEITIATTGGLAAGLLPRVVAAFRAENRSVKTSVRILPIGQIIAALASGECDLGVATGFAEDLDLETYAVVSGPLGAVMSPDHELAAKTSLSLADCREQKLVLADIGMPIRLVIDDACIEAGLTLEPVIESNSLEMLKRSAVLGSGLTFLYFPEVEEEVRRGDLVFVPLDDPHVAAQKLRIVYRPGEELRAGPKAFAEALKAAILPGATMKGAASEAAVQTQIDAVAAAKAPVKGRQEARSGDRRANQATSNRGADQRSGKNAGQQGQQGRRAT